jgi:hypothetical protein
VIEKPTVLILGAGASVHVGYPLGKTLIENVCKWSLDGLAETWRSQEEVRDFIRRLSRSAHYSIDAFLEQNPEYVELGRIVIARAIKTKEDIKRLFPPNDSGWYQYLFNTLASDGLEGFGANSLSIITFNYDRSLECYLHEALKARFRLSPDEATQHLRKLKIIHPHGMLGFYPEIPYEVGYDELLEISRGIKIIHEFSEPSDGAFCSGDFKVAHECLTNSERIFFLGFGFHLDNVRRLRFFTPETVKNRQILATLAGWGSRSIDELASRLEKSGFQRSMFTTYSSCEEFFEYVSRL